jgi:formylglycine-generating enzyme required for sulfatase activity/serine/threonine protein kinase
MSESFDPTLHKPLSRAGEYDLIRRMGAGGFGVVFEARHRVSGLPYAIKRIDMSAEDAERYRNEALYPARIASQSLHVMGVHSFFHEATDDAFYLVTELVSHGDLRRFLDTQPKPLPLTQGLDLAIGIARGLAAIHAQGIVHRDLKPNNVLMDRKDDIWVPKITDFGLARSSRSVSLGDFATSGYAAPEQLDLLSDQPLGPESDLFSFGMVLYELLTGEKPTPAQELREYGRWIGKRRPPPPASQVRPELAQWPQIDALLAQLLEFDRSRRLGSASEALRVLTAIARQAGAQNIGERLQIAPPTTTPASTPTPISPHFPAPMPTESTGPWSRWRVMSVMTGVLVLCGFAMTFGLPWANPGKFKPPVPETIFNFREAPFYAVVSWIVLPALFAFAVALGVELRASRAALVGVLYAALFQIQLSGLDTFVGAVSNLIVRALPDNPTVSTILQHGTLFVGGSTAAGFLLASLAPWHRPGRRTWLLVLAIGGIAVYVGVFSFWAPGRLTTIDSRTTLGFFFAVWQALVGTTIVVRSVFAAGKASRSWAWKPVVSAGGLAVLISFVASGLRSLPEPTKPGTVLENPNDKSKYAWIPPGEFHMGCSADDSECAADEEPAHEIRFTKGFWMGQNEVTVKEWKAKRPDLPPAAEWGGLVYNKGWVREDMPVVNVTWEQAVNYCASIGGRLPTETEWEYAARAGTPGARWARVNHIAHYADNSGSQRLASAALSDQALQAALVANLNSMTRVGSIENPWSLQTIFGNVSEWVQDDYGEGTYGLVRGTRVDPPAHLTGVAGAEKVVRGGSWASRPRDVRASARGRQAPEARSVFVGFRCVWNGPD